MAIVNSPDLAMWVTTSFMDLLGSSPTILGTTFTEKDDTTNSGHTDFLNMTLQNFTNTIIDT